MTDEWWVYVFGWLCGWWLGDSLPVFIDVHRNGMVELISKFMT